MRARNLVRYWFQEQVADGVQRYAGEGQRLSVPVAPERDRVEHERPEFWRRRKRKGRVVPITADGKTRRYVDVGAGGDMPAGPVSDPANPAVSGREHATRRIYVRQVMAHVHRVSVEAHAVLEMEAAGWKFPQIGVELGCSDPVARSYFEAGLAAVMSYTILVKPKWS